MDSTLGKILSALMVLVALALVVVFGSGALSRHSTNDLVGGISAMAANIQGDYANNQSGYGTLSNATVLAAGEVPADLLRNGQIVSPWGNPVTVSPVSGTPKNFQIDLGAVPVQNCVDFLVHTAGLSGAVVSSTQVTVPVDPATAAEKCASGGDLTLQFGSNTTFVASATLDSNAVPNITYVGTGPWGTNPFGQWVWNTPNFTSDAAVGNVNMESLVQNNTGSTQQVYLQMAVDNYIYGIKINGQSVPGNYPVAGWGVTTIGPVTLQPGTSRINVQANNAGGPAALQFQVVQSSNGAVLNSTLISKWYSTVNAF